MAANRFVTRMEKAFQSNPALKQTYQSKSKVLIDNKILNRMFTHFPELLPADFISKLTRDFSQQVTIIATANENADAMAVKLTKSDANFFKQWVEKIIVFACEDLLDKENYLHDAFIQWMTSFGWQDLDATSRRTILSVVTAYVREVNEQVFVKSGLNNAAFLKVSALITEGYPDWVKDTVNKSIFQREEKQYGKNHLFLFKTMSFAAVAVSAAVGIMMMSPAPPPLSQDNHDKNGFKK